MSLDVSLINADGEVVFSANITHNLNKMAAEAGIYKELWRPEEIGAVYAKDIAEKVGAGLSALAGDPAKFKAFNAPNGWGLYEHFLPWVAEYAQALRRHPEARIEVSR